MAASGMAQALNIASTRGFHVLADRGTWLTFKDRGDLTIVVEGDPRLINQYGVIVVNPTRNPQARREFAQAFADWLLSPGVAEDDCQLQGRRRAVVFSERYPLMRRRR